MKKYCLLIISLLGNVSLSIAMEDNFVPNCESISITNGRVATGIHYALESAHGGYLDRGGEKDGCTRTSLDAQKKYSSPDLVQIPGSDLVQWKLIPSPKEGYYALESAYGGYLDCGDNKSTFSNHVHTNPDAQLDWTWVQWKLIPSPKEGYYALESERGGYLDAGGGDRAWTNPNAKLDWSWVQWSFVPKNYELTSEIFDFNFGNFDEVNSILLKNKKLAFNSTQNLRVENPDLNTTIGGTYGEDVAETFSWGINGKIGLGVKTSFKAGIPFTANGELETSVNVEFGANESWTHNRTRKYSTSLAMNPKEPGIYQIGKIVYVSEDVKLPFTAKARLFAHRKSDGKKFYGDGVESLFNYEGLKDKLNANITSKGYDHVEVIVKGIFKATYAVWEEDVAKKISGI